MVEAGIDKPVRRTPRRVVATLTATAVATAVLGTGLAFAQSSGGVSAPGETTTTTTTTAPSGSMIFPVSGPHTDPSYSLSNWHELLSPYGPLFTLLTFAVVPLGVAGAFWSLKVLLVCASLAFAVTKTGTAGPDTLDGTPQSDSISGGRGNDKIKGEAGNDTLDGGGDSDTVEGGPGNDNVYGANCEYGTVGRFCDSIIARGRPRVAPRPRMTTSRPATGIS